MKAHELYNGTYDVNVLVKKITIFGNNINDLTDKHINSLDQEPIQELSMLCDENSVTFNEKYRKSNNWQYNENCDYYYITGERTKTLIKIVSFI